MFPMTLGIQEKNDKMRFPDDLSTAKISESYTLSHNTSVKSRNQIKATKQV